MIKCFKIINLFGFQDVEIPFESPIKILIGENGLGKTTVLNCLYYLLTNKFDKLSEIQFDLIEIQFVFDGKVHFVELSHFDIIMYVENSQRKMSRVEKNWYDQIRNNIDLNQLRTLVLSDNSEKDIVDFIRKSLSNKINHTNNKISIPPSGAILDFVYRFFSEEQLSFTFSTLSYCITKMDAEILYFPTYRRVEEELKNLEESKSNDGLGTYYEVEESSETLDDNTLIHFGMQDVEDRIENVKQEIKDSSIKGFSKVTGEMLSQLLKGFPQITEDELNQLDINTTKIILRRIGDNLPQKDRSDILKLLSRKDELFEKKELVYFLFKLTEIHHQHKHIDDAIKKFRDVCNEYLVGKEFKYDESAVDLRIFKTGKNIDPDSSVPLHKLSSGEKQIVSILSRIYLGKSKNLLVLFDEPELSLSIDWQKKLLPHICDSNHCNFLLAVTHSPFIFSNQLSNFAVSMSAYVTDSDPDRTPF